MSIQKSNDSRSLGIQNYLSEMRSVFSLIDTQKIENLQERVTEVRNRRGTIYIIGNGGSALAASHWSCDLGKCGIQNLEDPAEKRLKILPLTDIATITAYANDRSYDEIFSQPIRSLIEDDDLLLAISASGNSENVLGGVQVARAKNAYVFGLLGNDGGRISKYCNDCLIVPSKNYGIIEDVHSMVGHMVTEYLRGSPNEMK